MSSTSGDQTVLHNASKSCGWVMRSLLSPTEGVKAFIWLPDTIFFDKNTSNFPYYLTIKIEAIKSWIYTTPLGFVSSIPADKHTIDLILARFSKLNNVNSLAKPSFLNQDLYGPWHVSTNYLDVQNRFFANIMFSDKSKESVTLQQFMQICEKIMNQEDLADIRSIQAYRDHRIPLAITKSREIFSHCIEYRDSKYYSLVKNRIFSILTSKRKGRKRFGCKFRKITIIKYKSCDKLHRNKS